ncbi:ligand-binding sensor domain-containing protein [Psychroserpens ponticola]|uniref:Histidine kinase n=1 Tax=Psychroserpens ponticola TaxID=2932268 RepID=A0ABY7RYI1_9FLAO|nr:two-component regulator propeller domain-containing protein [Psychroserpens ponticola]WCO01746.1 histidine kinase [Psychroserpens ponticola]
MQSQNKQLRAYTLEDGLPQSQVYALTLDAKGYLWLGTQGGGLARFDGSDFKVFNKTHGLASNYIHAIKASNDTLFLGTQKGISVKVKDVFYNIKTPQVNEILKFGHTVYALTDNGLYKLINGISVEKVKLHSVINNSQINDLVFDGNYFWVATNNGLWKLSALNSEAKTIEQLDHNDYIDLAILDAKIFASTFNYGTLVIETQNFEDAYLIRTPLRINSISIQNSNQLWIATDNEGVSVVDTETFKVLFTIKNTNGLSTSDVREVLSDQHGNIWIGTSGGGLYKYFQNSFKHYNIETGLNGNRIYAVHHNENGLWVSNSEAGLMKIDPMGIHDVELPEAFSQVKIKSITSDKNGNIWAGSDGKGLVFKGKVLSDSIAIDTLKKSKKRIPIERLKTKIFNTENGFPFDWIRTIHTENDTVWAATYSNGIVKFSYDPELDDITIYRTYSSLEGLEDVYIMDMTKDDDGRLWYATKNGHLGYLKENRITHLGLALDQDISINSIVVQNSTVFLGTAGNGVWWSNDTNFSVFKKLKGTKNLTSENVYQLIFDDQGYLWIGSEKGVDKVELSKDYDINDVFFFGRNDGFLGIETCLNAVDKDHKGHLWFGAINGLTEYQPTDISLNLKKPKLFLEDVKVAYKSIDTINLSLWSNSDKVLRLNPNQNQVSFSFKSIDVNHPNGIEYRYKLNDNDWSLWSTNNTQDFSELNYGAHKFITQSRNYRWIESEPTRFSFFIEKPLYKKTWFQWLIIGITVLIFVFSILQYVKRLKNKNRKEQERLQLENHLLTLEQKALRLQMNPHFIFNVLNGIKAMAPTKPEKMNDTVNSFATLLRETLVNSRKDKIGLDQEIKTLKHYIEVERLMAEESFEYDIILNTDLDVEEILIPPMLIQPFVENAIRHGILKGPRKGKLKVQFDTTDEILKVAIEDNGIGIYNSQQQKPKTDHQSMALKVTRERLESISGKDALKINETKQKDGTIDGTTIVFKIPLETDY